MLKQVRERIDALDDQILSLMSERARQALEVARVKRAAGESGDFYRPDREAEVLRRLCDANPGPLSNDTVALLFREIMSACLALQQPLKVAYLGPEGTFTEAAAIKQFGHGMVGQPLATIDHVFRDVEAGTAHYGVVPVENSTEGVVTHTLDRFMSSPLQIIGEVELVIHQNLLSNEQERDAIKRVFSHQQPFGQCRAWLDAHLPHAERIVVSSTAEAARMASETPATAAIASDVAAERYGLNVLDANIEDGAVNTTRFLVIGNQSPSSTGEDKTSLVISRSNQPGGLYRLLEPLSRQGVNMSRIESRPSRQGMWEYVFFVDLLGHVDDEPVKRALEEIQQQASLLKVLGSYPRAAR
ncbi:prephenate dehydratase [Alkalilimnicola ehrlichii]|nr:prephenate dehydratase [Alkalilimnicola ehrlichii]